MKNIPLFTSTYGLATLVLREIPWNGTAYVLIRSVWNDQTEALLTECAGFCRAVGAERIFAAWDTAELPGEHAYDMLWMARPKQGLPRPEKPVDLEPLTPENGAHYLKIYNQCFRDVPSAASYDKASLDRLYGEDLAWLARVEGTWAGVAEISTVGLEGIAVLPEFRGLGYDLALSVLAMVPNTTLRLKVASTNEKARCLYTRLGFREDGLNARWYRLA